MKEIKHLLIVEYYLLLVTNVIFARMVTRGFGLTAHFESAMIANIVQLVIIVALVFGISVFYRRTIDLLDQKLVVIVFTAIAAGILYLLSLKGLTLVLEQQTPILHVTQYHFPLLAVIAGPVLIWVGVLLVRNRSHAVTGLNREIYIAIVSFSIGVLAYALNSHYLLFQSAGSKFQFFLVLVVIVIPMFFCFAATYSIFREIKAGGRFVFWPHIAAVVGATVFPLLAISI